MEIINLIEMGAWVEKKRKVLQNLEELTEKVDFLSKTRLDDGNLEKIFGS